jgi:hypothetical protein
MRFRSSWNRTSIFQPIVLQLRPTEPNSAGFGLSSQNERAMPIAATRVSENEKMMSPGATSRMNS